MGDYYMEVEGEVVSTDDVREWATAQENRKHVAKTDVGDLTVSTVFLGLDHGFGAAGPPVLWETMVYKRLQRRDGRTSFEFDIPNEYQWRYTSREEALRHHEEVVKWVQGGMKGDGPGEERRS